MSSLRSLDQMRPAEVAAIVTAEGEEHEGYEAEEAFARRRLLSALIALGVRPFSPKRVEQYKRSKLHPMLGELGQWLWDTDLPLVSHFGWLIAKRHFLSLWEERNLQDVFPEHAPPEPIARLARRITDDPHPKFRTTSLGGMTC